MKRPLLLSLLLAAPTAALAEEPPVPEPEWSPPPSSMESGGPAPAGHIDEVWRLGFDAPASSGTGGAGLAGQQTSLAAEDPDLLPGGLPSAEPPRVLAKPARVEPFEEDDAALLPLEEAYGLQEDPEGDGEGIPVRKSFAPELLDSTGAL